MDDKITITVCGDGGCGKSSIVLRLVRGQWDHGYDPTIEDSYSVTRTIDGTTHHLHLTDTAGQEEYRGMWSSPQNLYSDAFLLVYDITSESSLDDLDNFVQLIETEMGARMQSGRVCPALMVVGNKVDLASQRRVSARMGLEWARTRGMGFMETSARDMVNVEETFAAVVKRTVEARRGWEEGRAPILPSAAIRAATRRLLDPREEYEVDEKEEEEEEEGEKEGYSSGSPRERRVGMYGRGDRIGGRGRGGWRGRMSSCFG